MRFFPFVSAGVFLLAAASAIPETAIAQTTAYVANGNDASATLIDTEDFTTSSLVPTGGQHDIAVTSDGRFAYVAAVSVVAVVDLAADTVITNIGTSAEGVAITPDDKYVYVANGGNGVAVIDVETNSIVTVISVLGMTTKDVVITPDGTLAYVSSNDSGIVEAIDVASNTVVANINAGVSPDGLAVSPDGKLVYVALNENDTVTKIDVETNSTVGSLGGVGGDPTSVAITPDGSKLYVAGAVDSSVIVFDVSVDTVLTRINAGAANHRGLAVTPDGRHVYVTNLNASSVTVIDVNADTVVAMIPVAGAPRQVTIGLKAQGGGTTAVERAELPGKRRHLLGNAPNPFSDRTAITFELDEAAHTTIDVFDVQGRLVRTLHHSLTTAGVHTIGWDGLSNHGDQVAAGIYVLRLSAGNGFESRIVTRAR